MLTMMAKPLNVRRIKKKEINLYGCAFALFVVVLCPFASVCSWKCIYLLLSLKRWTAKNWKGIFWIQESVSLIVLSSPIRIIVRFSSIFFFQESTIYPLFFLCLFTQTHTVTVQLCCQECACVYYYNTTTPTTTKNLSLSFSLLALPRLQFTFR